MEPTLSDRLLGHLRERLGTGVDFAEAPKPLSGGFDTTILAFRLSGAPAAWERPLILRVMTRSDQGPRVLREAAVHAALVQADFPAPRVLLHETDLAPLGLPFLVMERLPGETMWSALAKAGPLAFLAMPRQLAELHVRLHRVSGEAVRESARALGVDPAVMGVQADVERLHRRIVRDGLAALRPAADWLVGHFPAPVQAEVICHADFHPLNIMMDGHRLSGVIDWANVVIGEPAYDVAALRTIAFYVDLGIPVWARGATNLARRLMMRRYMSLYRAAAPLATRNLPYYEAIRILSALIFAAGERPPAGNPWNAPHTVKRLVREFERISGLSVRL
ncbi:MAG: phosphotransferase [Reyranella sp.]|uniref:phosphotransferase family protein n=1 Tax=Reyranella sp. TaxID=1929291 RepID=UPI001ACD6A87|nr:phosphotransferase [Reyranella sp.]MBN9087945.1 phosphotransferase [Reyranella sp.]